MPLTVAEFVHRWKTYDQSEEAGAKPHFLDLCELLGQRHPAAADSAGENYAFEKHVRKTSGAEGFADVWFRDHFAWEYKKKRKDLNKAYAQLNDYREELGNPPLLVVCDFDRFEVHTNYTRTNKRVYKFNLDDLNRNLPTADCPLPPLDVLRALFGDTDVLRPERTDAQVTQEVAKKFARLAERLEIEGRSASREEVAHFLMRLLFCLFADSIGLLPDHLFRKTIENNRFSPNKFMRMLSGLFQAMSYKDEGGVFGPYSIKHFNGDLFNSDAVMQLDQADLGILYDVSKNYDWSRVAPAIFGTLFERSLDPKRRSLIGAHYTSEQDILTLIEPVLMRPLRQRWADYMRRIVEAFERERAEEAARDSKQARLRIDRQSEKLLGQWIEELTAIRVLDPACGSGNFLYVALRQLLDLWREARDFAIALGISVVLPKMVSPRQLYGIEIEFYAHELASVVVWIGFLQWKHEHGEPEDKEPVLEKLTNIEHGDAILRYDAEGKPYEPEWPRADFIVGNPPFLGINKMRKQLPTPEHPNYVDELRELYVGRVPGGVNLVIYWFERARQQIRSQHSIRAGLIATQAIRKGSNRSVLDHISAEGQIFYAISSRNWILDGANVGISLIGFDNGKEEEFLLDGVKVSKINPDLTAGIDITEAHLLAENKKMAFEGVKKYGDFEVDSVSGQKMLKSPINPNGRPNSDVVVPWINGDDLTDRPMGRFILDFSAYSDLATAALYEMPFEYLRTVVFPDRQKEEDQKLREKWWLFERSRPALRKSLKRLRRYIGTPRVSKHRIFCWVSADTLPDTRVVAIARDSDFILGLLQSRAHEIWSLRTSSRHGDGEDGGRVTYNKTICFDTFPFPWAPCKEPSEAENPLVKAIADAARELVRLRDAWLNPSGIDPAELKTRTLTNLYNQRPAWLANAHEALDRAVFAAYSWPYPLTRDEILARLLKLNHERAAAHPSAQ